MKRGLFEGVTKAVGVTEMTDQQIVEELAECAALMAYMLVERPDRPIETTPQLVESARLLVGEVRKLGQIVGLLRVPGGAPALPA